MWRFEVSSTLDGPYSLFCEEHDLGEATKKVKAWITENFCENDEEYSAYYQIVAVERITGWVVHEPSNQNSEG